MKKSTIFTLTLFMLSYFCVFAQSDDEFFDNDGGFFSSEEDLFGNDDGIDVIEEVSAKTDLSKGILFENGSVKIGGIFTTSVSAQTVLYSEQEKSFGENLKDTILQPKANAFLSVDARPNQNLRMYTKFGIKYPYSVNANLVNPNPLIPGSKPDYNTKISVKDWFTLKELFTDFSIADTAFFRFGLHTVTWGTGYFFSPVSDLINTSSINPEDTTAQVDGSLNLRTQIVFPNSQNCLWFYVIPSTDFISNTTAESYLRDTALAGKADIIIGNWELGVGGFWKYQNAPKAMLTATGSLKNISIFGEFVWRYGSDSEWQENSDWDNKTNIIQATVGLSRYWKNPAIMLAAQYYYDGNDIDFLHKYLTYGHNIAATANFGKILGNSDFTANIFAMVNFGKKDIPDFKASLISENSLNLVNTFVLSGMVNYSPISALTVGMGPYITWKTFENKPTVSLKITATLGGGKF